ncbi:WecB/TagA/CpsF family glycosyltransferase [Cycloclasticus pugetii]|uniref:WecB/TagA/CpsF family glycosyltransferase n=1 Tax=Cycloclasticus pugetii TaxID=34068 RepID=UPI003A8FE1D7
MDCKKINGVNIFAPSSREELIDFALKNHSLLVAVNAEKILHATEQLRDIINRNVGYPDGVGAIMALNKQGVSGVVKVPGCELWLDIISLLYKHKSFYLVGGKDVVVQKTVTKLQQDFPGINIVNFRNGYLRSQNDKSSLLDDISEKKPDVVFVAMGSPKQELLMEEMNQRHKALYQGLGGSFDVYIGNVKRAPKWWVRNNLEWLFRLLTEPSRIKRQIHLVRFWVMLKFRLF